MTVDEIICLLEMVPGDMQVNVHLQYAAGIILRCPGVKICYVDSEGTINDKPVADLNEISIFVDEALFRVKKIFL